MQSGCAYKKNKSYKYCLLYFLFGDKKAAQLYVCKC